MPGNVVLHARRLGLRRLPAASHWCCRNRVLGLALEEHPSITQLAGKLLQGGPLVRRPRSRRKLLHVRAGSCAEGEISIARWLPSRQHEQTMLCASRSACFTCFEIVVRRRYLQVCVSIISVIYHQRPPHCSNDGVHAQLHTTMHTCYTSNATTREEMCFNTTRHITLNTTLSLPPINSATPAPRSWALDYVHT
jgi:hypothetical protein